MILDGGIPVFGSEQGHNFVQVTLAPSSTTKHRTASKSFVSGWFPSGAAVIIVTEDRRLCDVGRSHPTAVADKCRLRAKINPWRNPRPLFHPSYCIITCYNRLPKRGGHSLAKPAPHHLQNAVVDFSRSRCIFARQMAKLSDSIAVAKP
jgi:hypothetical protein